MYTKEDYFEIQKAVRFLYESYKNALDDTKPELLHSLNVGFRLMQYNYSRIIVISGFLHDVLEEGLGGEKVTDLFGQKIYSIIEANTKNKTINGWELQYADLLPRIGKSGVEALTVKAADILDNLMYRTNINDTLGKQKVSLLAELLFKEITSEEGVFGELKKMYKDRLEKL